MFGITKWGAWIMLNQISDRVKISDLRAKVPLYGAAFDYAISTLQMAGLVRVVREGNEEYVELTDLGKNVKSWYASYPYIPPPIPWGPGWGWLFGGWGWHGGWRRWRWLLDW
jgi:DNA-binding transcriptional ArsR family regulator